MPHPEPTDDHTYQHRWLLVGTIALTSLIVVVLIVAGVLQHQQISPPDVDIQTQAPYTQAGLKEEAHITHDEMVMMIISLIVAVMIAANFDLLLRIPHGSLILSSFILVALSSIFTVAESFVWPETLNYLEHLCFMAAAIIFAVWCMCVFCFKRGPAS